MKNYLLRIYLLIIILSINGPTIAQNDEFVTIEGKEFKLGGDPFYPIVANYGLSIYKDIKYGVTTFHIAPQFWQFGRAPRPFPDTGYVNQGDYLNYTEFKTAIIEDFKILIQHGFNAIRITTGVEEEWLKIPGSCDRYSPPRFGNCLGFRCNFESSWCSFHPISGTGSYYDIFNIYSEVIDAANAASGLEGKPLKIIFLTGGTNMDQDHRRHDYANYLGSLADHFKDNPTILGYDFYNEPGNSWNQTGVIEDPVTGEWIGEINPSGDFIGEHEKYSKQEVCEIISEWNNAVKSHSNHLTTIGLFGASDVFQWDPGVMDLDFISFHVYPESLYADGNTSGSNPNMIKILNDYKRKTKWIANTINKPWIIGETGLSSPLNNECMPNEGSNEDQRYYAEQTLAFTRDAGGKGYSWWHYRDADGSFCTDTKPSGYHAYYGLFTMGLPVGMTPCPPALYNVTNGNCTYSVGKSAVDEFLSFDPFDISYANGQIDDDIYYNPFNFTQVAIGSVQDINGAPISNAYIQGKIGGRFFSTYSRADGSFSLYYKDEGNSGLTDVFASAINAEVKAPKHSTPTYLFKLERIKDNRTVSGTYSSNSLVEAVNNIAIANTTIIGNGSTGANCEFTAGNKITINPNFQAQKGCHFLAQIDNINCSSLPILLPPQSTSCETSPHNNEDLQFAEKKMVREQTPQLVNMNILEFNINPNPTSGAFFISSSDTDGLRKEVSIYDAFGSFVSRIITNDQHIKVEIPGNNKGIYFVTITCDNTYFSQKVIVN